MRAMGIGLTMIAGAATVLQAQAQTPAGQAGAGQTLAVPRPVPAH
jgi:hypothetical protein